MLGATIGVATQYFGDPIRSPPHPTDRILKLFWIRNKTDQKYSLFSSCEFQGLDSDLAQDYCWIHGSAYIPRPYQVIPTIPPYFAITLPQPLTALDVLDYPKLSGSPQVHSGPEVQVPHGRSHHILLPVGLLHDGSSGSSLLPALQGERW